MQQIYNFKNKIVLASSFTEEKNSYLKKNMF